MRKRRGKRGGRLRPSRPRASSQRGVAARPGWRRPRARRASRCRPGPVARGRARPGRLRPFLGLGRRGLALRQASSLPGHRTSHLLGATPGRPARSDEKSGGCARGHALGLAGAPARGGICRELGESGGFSAARGSGIQPRAGLFLSPPDRERGLPERGFTAHGPRPNESSSGGAVGAQGHEAESPEAQSSASDQTWAQSPEPGRRAHGEPWACLQPP